jgi:hypothetical protein
MRLAEKLDWKWLRILLIHSKELSLYEYETEEICEKNPNHCGGWSEQASNSVPPYQRSTRP